MSANPVSANKGSALSILAGGFLSVIGLGLVVAEAGAQESAPATNVVLITLDGLRGEEVFGGADERLMRPELGVKNLESAVQAYGGDTAENRRKRLLPFLWRQIEQGEAWIAGDPQHNSTVKATNGLFFSYPGYNEILSGFADPRIISNAKSYNENRTVLEWLNQRPELSGRVLAFCSWDVFPFIINDRRSGIEVNAGWTPLTIGSPEVLETLNHTADNLFHEWDGVRYDVFTVAGAIAAMQSVQPRLLYVSLGETDDWAHAGRYDRYLLTAQQNDRFIEQLWTTCQSLPTYRGRTAFLVTTDHGRGDGREGWKNHGLHLAGSERIWIAAFGTGIAVSGQDTGREFQQAQVAATVAKLLGFDFCASDPRIAPALPVAK